MIAPTAEEYVVYPKADQQKKREPKGFGAWFDRCLDKVGLGPSMPAGTGGAIFTGARVAAVGAVNDGGFLGGLLATNYGIAALGITGVTAIMMGTACVSWITSLARPTAGFDHLGQRGVFAMPPKPAAPPADALAQAPEASASLDYLNQAIKNDPWLQDRINEAAGVKPPAAKAAPPAAASAHAASPATTSPPPAAAAVARPVLSKMQDLDKGRAVALGGASSPLKDGEIPYRDALNKAPKMSGVTPFGRHMTAVAGGRQAGSIARGARTSDALLRAAREGLAQKSNHSPSMQGAGLTFDGAGSAIQGAPVSPVNFGGIPNDDGRVSPNSVLDQSQVPGPVPATGDTNDAAPYQWAMVGAIAALLAAMVLSKMGGSMKDEAKKMQPGPAQAQAYRDAANMYWLAAGAGGAAAAFGAVIMGMYQQAQQGMIFVTSGGMLAAFNAKAALDAMKSAQDSTTENQKAMDGINSQDGQIDQQLGSQASSDGGSGDGSGPAEY